MPTARKAAPRYRSIADTLRKQIGDGRYQVGGRLPTEERLCEMFGASRLTLREALRSLSEDGLIVRRPRLGSTVVASRSPMVFVQTVASIESLLNYPTETIRRTVETGYVEADPLLASQLQCAPWNAWFRISALRFPKGHNVPICWTDIYIAPKYASVVRHKRHETTLVADQIAEMFGEIAARTQIELSAGAVPAKFARRLGVKAGSPALNVLRRYTGTTGELFEASISVHPGERYTYSFEFRRERQAVRKAIDRSE
jgi:GntR family transcriptional regulator